MKCQYSKHLISVPIRSIHCQTHYQPYDLNSFIWMNTSVNQSARIWKCPICRKRSYDIVIDDYLCQIIQKENHPCHITFNNKGQLLSIEHESSQEDNDHLSDEITKNKKQIDHKKDDKIVDKSLQSVMNKIDAIQIQDNQQNVIDPKRKYKQKDDIVNSQNIISKRLESNSQKCMKNVNNLPQKIKSTMNPVIIQIDLQQSQQKTQTQLKNQTKQSQIQQESKSNTQINIKKKSLMINQTKTKDRKQQLNKNKLVQKIDNKVNNKGTNDEKEKKLRQQIIAQLNKIYQDDDLLNGKCVHQNKKIPIEYKLSALNWRNSLITFQKDIE